MCFALCLCLTGENTVLDIIRTQYIANNLFLKYFCEYNGLRAEELLFANLSQEGLKNLSCSELCADYGNSLTKKSS